MSGILAIWNDCDPAVLSDYERWYAQEHLPERLAVPGFRSGQRYESSIGRGERFFTWYEVDGPEVLSSPAYLSRLADPTPWTLRLMPSFRAMSRTVCERVAAAGRLAGAHVVTLRLDRRPIAGPGVADLMARLAERDGVGRVQLWAAVRQTPVGTREAQARGGNDAGIHGALIIECLRREDAEACAAMLETHGPPAGLGAEAAGPTGLYTLLCRIEAEVR